MNGLEFFERTWGRPADRILWATHAVPGGKKKRLIPGVAMAVYEDEAVMNVDYGLGCHVVTASEKEFLRREILEGFERPTLLLRFTQAKVDPRDLMVTYDPRRARLVMPGAVLTFNAELLRRGEFAEGSSEAHVARLAAIRGGRET